MTEVSLSPSHTPLLDESQESCLSINDLNLANHGASFDSRQSQRTPPKRRASSISKSYDDLENLDYTHFQKYCKTGANYTLSIIRLLGKLSEGYERFGKTLTSTVELESNFLSRYTKTKFNKDSTYLSSFELMCEFTKDLAVNFQQIAFEIKTKMMDPLLEFQKQCDGTHNTIYKKHDQCHNKFKNDEGHLNQYAEKYKSITREERDKFKLIRLLSSGIMPPNDHKTLKKSWHSPSKLNKSMSKLLKKAQIQKRKVSMRLGHSSDRKSSLLATAPMGSDPESKDQEDEKHIDDIYEYNTKLEIERMNEDKQAHVPLLYAMLRYSSTRNKLLKHEDIYTDQIESLNHSMTQYQYVRKETMKTMKKMQIERLVLSKNTMCTLVEVFNDDKYQIFKKESFLKFVESTTELNPQYEFDEFLKTSQDFKMKYVRSRPLISNQLLIEWRTPYHLMEDLMFNQMYKKHINKNTLKVPFVFEYLMEQIEHQQGINDPDIFMANAMSPKESHMDHSFTFERRMSPEYTANDMDNDANEELTMKTTDLYAIPVLSKQIDELYQCKPVKILDHHHAIILLKLWLYKSPEPIVPYYLYDSVCEFQEMNTVQQRSNFVRNDILSDLSPVRLHCLARLVSICKKILKEQHETTIIDLSYELSNVIIRNPAIKAWRQLDPVNNGDQDNVDDMNKLRIMLDPQSTYKLPLSPSHREKRAEMAFITYILSNDVPMLNDKKFVNYGQKLNKQNMDSQQNQAKVINK